MTINVSTRYLTAHLELGAQTRSAGERIGLMLCPFGIMPCPYMLEDVRAEFGHGLYLAQVGQRHVNAKPHGESIELIERLDGDSYRCGYNIRIDDDLCVLHAFQKK